MDIFRKILRLTLRVAAGLGILLIALMTTAQIILSPKVCTSLINKYVSDLVDGRLQVKSASVSLFSHFPAISADIDSVILTYPSERFDSSERCGAQSWMVFAGTPHLFNSSASEDTLARFTHLQASINVLPLIAGRINVKNVELSQPRVFLHFYADGKSNLDIFNFRLFSEDSTASQQKDTGKVMLPPIKIRKVSLTDRPAIFLSYQKDSLFILTTLKEFIFSGNLDLDNPDNCHFSTRVDSLLLAGSVPRDTLSYGVDYLEASASHHVLKLDASAKIHSATRAFGRIRIPINLSGAVDFSLRKDEPIWLNFHNFGLSVATIYADLNLAAEISDSIDLKGTVSIPALGVGKLCNGYVANFFPPLAQLNTDAVLTCAVDVDGVMRLSPFRLPKLECRLDLPQCSVSYPAYIYKPKLELHATASADKNGVLGASVTSLRIDCGRSSADSLALSNDFWLKLDLAAKASDLLGKDPLFYVDALADANIDKMNPDVVDMLGLDITGNLAAKIDGEFNLSNINPYDFPKARLNVDIESDGVSVHSKDDSLEIYAAFIKAGTNLKDLKTRSKRSIKALSANLSVDSLYYRYGSLTHATGRKIRLGASLDTKEVKVSDSLSYCPLFISAEIGKASLMDSDSLGFRLRNSRNGLFVHPPKSYFASAAAASVSPVPVINIKSRNERVFMRTGVHRFFVKDLDLSSRFKMNPDQNSEMRKHIMDSLYNLHPDWNKDSLKHYFKEKVKSHKVPEWMSEKDFRKADLNLDLGKTFKTYFNRWDINAELKMSGGGLATPAFPLKTRISGFQGSFNNDRLSLDSLTVCSGSSDLRVNGQVNGLRDALMRHMPLELKLSVNTDSLDLDEIIAAYTKGDELMKKDLGDAMSNADYGAVEARIEEADITAEDVPEDLPLIVVPANVVADIRMDGKRVNFAGLDIQKFGAGIKMGERCLLLEDLTALSNVGNVYLDAFYSTRTKSNLCTGFFLNLEDISAGQVIELMPSIDTLMPLLKSFDGRLSCSLAATSDIDTSMNLVLPSIDGVIRISGNGLHFNNSIAVKKIAKKLMFRNPESVAIDSMVVEGILNNSTLEVFPFFLKMDRWQLALAGIQNLDQSFRYHISVIKSPLPFRLGLNFYGKDFDNMKFSLGKAKYKSLDNLPVFTTQIDSARVNLVSSIRNVLHTGAEMAVMEHERKMQMDAERKKQNYVNSVADEGLDKLSSGELRKLEGAE